MQSTSKNHLLKHLYEAEFHDKVLPTPKVFIDYCTNERLCTSDSRSGLLVCKKGSSDAKYYNGHYHYLLASAR
jgi:hypothetical protein